MPSWCDSGVTGSFDQDLPRIWRFPYIYKNILRFVCSGSARSHRALALGANLLVRLAQEGNQVRLAMLNAVLHAVLNTIINAIPNAILMRCRLLSKTPSTPQNIS